MKRFTATEKWGDEWFRKLKPAMKLIWQYMLDQCDHAGIWRPDLEMAEFQIGLRIGGPSDVIEAMAGRVRVLDNGKWFIVRFIQFQQRTDELNPSNKAHVNILRSLELNGISDYSKALQSPLPAPNKGLQSPIGIGKVKEEVKKGSAEGGEIQADLVPPFDPKAQINTLYRRREATPWSDKERKALAAAGEITPEELNLIERYYAKERAKGEAGIHRRDMQTFLNNYRTELDRARMTVKAPLAPKTTIPPASVNLASDEDFKKQGEEFAKLREQLSPRRAA